MPAEADHNESIVNNNSNLNPALGDVGYFRDAAYYPRTSVMDATGQLQWQDLTSLPYKQNVSSIRWGTAFFIREDLIMTAGHCFDPQKRIKGKGWKTPTRHDGSQLSASELAPLMQLNMGYELGPDGQGDPMQNQASYNVTELMEYRLGGLDYAIARVAGSPGKQYGCVKINVNFSSGQVYIVQHPSGAPKKQEIGTGEKVGELVKHTANTLPASSGSPVTADYDAVVALHIAGPDQAGKRNRALNMMTIFLQSPILQNIVLMQNMSVPKELNPVISEPKPGVTYYSSSEVVSLLICLCIASFGAYIANKAEKPAGKVAGGVLAVSGGIGFFAILTNGKKYPAALDTNSKDDQLNLPPSPALAP